MGNEIGYVYHFCLIRCAITLPTLLRLCVCVYVKISIFLVDFVYIEMRNVLCFVFSSYNAKSKWWLFLLYFFCFVCHVVKSKDVGSANYSSKLFRYDFACSVICFIIIVYGFLLQRCEVLCYAKVHMFFVYIVLFSHGTSSDFFFVFQSGCCCCFGCHFPFVIVRGIIIRVHHC